MSEVRSFIRFVMTLILISTLYCLWVATWIFYVPMMAVEKMFFWITETDNE